jgi:dGTPase
LIEIYDSYGNDYHRYKKSPVPLDRRFGNYLKKMEGVYRKKSNAKQIVTDYIAGMTDGYALRCMREISLPEELSFE